MGVGRLICWAKNVGLAPLGSRKGWFIKCNTITTPQACGGAPAGNSFHSGPPAGASLLSDSLYEGSREGRRHEAGPAPTSSQACLPQLFNALNTPREPHHQLPGVKRMPEKAACFKSETPSQVHIATWRENNYLVVKSDLIKIFLKQKPFIILW